MKKPSIHQLAQNAKDALIRFPWVLLSALIGSLAGIYLVQVSEVSQNVFPIINLMLSAALGIPLFFSIRMLLEKENLSKFWAAGLYVSAFVVLMGIYFSLPDQDNTWNTFQPYIRYAIYNVCLHLVVSFLPFVWDKDIISFWNYNITLLIRILTAILYSIVLYIGMILALLAIHLLFDLNFDEKIYPQLFILMIGLFNTWFFLSGIPDKTDQPEGAYRPKELKVFAQYILLTLLAVYLLILYGYGAKIVLIWDWPRGIVSYLIICVAVLGITTFLLLYPYGRLDGNNWIKKSTLAFHYLLIPLLVLLFIAVSMRLGDYGFTVNRYLIFLLGVWLAVTCLYFIFGKRNPKFIPISLAVLAFLVSFGPWGVFSVSEKSQVERLREILSQVQILEGNTIQAEIIWDTELLPQLDSRQDPEDPALLTDSRYSEISSILHYLDDYHGFEAIRPWFSQDLDHILSLVNKDQLKWQRMQEAQLYMETMGLKYESASGYPSIGFYSFQADLKQAVTVTESYEYLVSFNLNKAETKQFTLDGSIYQLRLDESGQGLLFETNDDATFLPLQAFMEKLLNESKEQQNKDFHSIPQAKMIYLDEAIPGLKLEIHHINFQNTAKDNLELTFISGFLLFKKGS